MQMQPSLNEQISWPGKTECVGAAPLRCLAGFHNAELFADVTRLADTLHERAQHIDKIDVVGLRGALLLETLVIRGNYEVQTADEGFDLAQNRVRWRGVFTICIHVARLCRLAIDKRRGSCSR